jgi:hypothetical protein
VGLVLVNYLSILLDLVGHEKVPGPTFLHFRFGEPEVRSPFVP